MGPLIIPLSTTPRVRVNDESAINTAVANCNITRYVVETISLGAATTGE